MALVEVVDLGRMSYQNALQKQLDFHSMVCAAEKDHVILLVEHDPVITLGKNSDSNFLLFSENYFRDNGIELIHTDRGGQVTAHMPGQLVLYPIIDMKKLNLSVRKYVGILENSVTQVLKQYGVESNTDLEHPGVWVGENKICAIGVRIKSHVSMHGLALNVLNDLSLFEKIVPCGIHGRGVTSLSKIVNGSLNFEKVKQDLIDEIVWNLTN